MYYDQITLAVQVNGGGTPSSYAWSGDVYGNQSTVIFDGPNYDLSYVTSQNSAIASCTVVINGTSYSSSTVFDYSVNDFN